MDLPIAEAAALAALAPLEAAAAAAL